MARISLLHAPAKQLVRGNRGIGCRKTDAEHGGLGSILLKNSLSVQGRFFGFMELQPKI
jgi:hypothetical protein